MTKEEKFYEALKDIFIGVKVQGDSGFVNLMKIKSNYFDGIFKHFNKDVESALKPFPDFREELFDKLHSFFSRYFSESGSIYFTYTPFSQNIYERVYTNESDVALFWKTHMLYYVKTEILFQNLTVETDDHKFYFDVSKLAHKKVTSSKESTQNALPAKIPSLAILQPRNPSKSFDTSGLRVRSTTSKAMTTL